MGLIAFDDSMFPDTVVYRAVTKTLDNSMGEVQTEADSGDWVTYSCRVTDSSAGTKTAGGSEGQKYATQSYEILLPEDPGCSADDHFVWRGLTLVAMGKARNRGGESVLFVVEAMEAE